MQKLNLRMHLITLLVFVVNSCANLPNVPICAEISLSRGVCTYTVSGKTVVVDDEHPIDGTVWFELRTRALLVPASSWASLKSYLIKQCRKTNQCKNEIVSWDRDLGLDN